MAEKRIPIARFVAALGAALERGDGYIMGAYGQNPRTGSLDLNETAAKPSWKPGGWYYAQYTDPAQRAQALTWRETCARVWDCNGLAEGVYQLETGVNINSKARYNYADWCDPKGEGLIPAARRVPGAAVFWGEKASKITHVAYLFQPVEAADPAGDWYLIEARGVMTGVVKTRLFQRKPRFWGLMTKYFDYGEAVVNGELGMGNGEFFEDALRRGDGGEAVRAMQEALLGLGFDLGKWGADGEFGRATEAAVAAFQRERGLPETGIFGAAERAALEDSAAPKTYTVTLRGLSAVEAALIREKWKDCEVTEEPCRTSHLNS